MFGDLLQLKPTAAKFIFDEPSNEQFQLRHAIESLWEKFKIVNLTKNHRQGSDKEFADILNRIRIGNLTDEDVEKLETRIVPRDSPHIPRDTIWLCAVNEDVNKINEERLETLDRTLLTIPSIVLNRTEQKSKPIVTSAGTIRNTPLQSVLKIKVGARVMLTFNTDTSDGLTNGALGEIVGYDISDEGKIKTPMKLVVDLSKVFEAAQAYVMLSRVQELDQLIILDSLPQKKIYPGFNRA